MTGKRPHATAEMLPPSGIALKDYLGDPQRSYNYDDLDILEGERAFSRSDTQPDISGRFTLRIRLRVPLVAAPMPDVTNAHIATVAARKGGLGIIPPMPDLEEGVEMVRTVRGVESGFKENPFALAPNDLVEHVLAAPYSNIPVLHERKLVGMLYRVQHSNYYFAPHAKEPVSRVMQSDLDRITVPLAQVSKRGQLHFATAKEIMIARSVPALGVIAQDGTFLFLVTMKDAELREEYPDATRDSEGRLRVGAAVFEYFTPDNLGRIRNLVDAGANPIVIEQAHGWNVDIAKLTSHLVDEYRDSIDVVCGNDSAGRAAILHWNSGADGWKIGNGPGQACDTGKKSNVGLWRPQFSAVYDCANAMHLLTQNLGGDALPCCADGGVDSAYTAFKGLCAGAETFMVGTMMAQTTDSPAEDTGRGTKLFRAMGSPELAKKNAIAAGRYDPKKFLPEGRMNEVSKTVPAEQLFDEMRAKLSREFERVGARNQQELHEKLRDSRLRAQLEHKRPN